MWLCEVIGEKMCNVFGVITGKENRKPANIEKENSNGKPPINKIVETIFLVNRFVFSGRRGERISKEVKSETKRDYSD